MMRVLVVVGVVGVVGVVALVACHKKADAPKFYLDGGAVVAKAADAPPAIDAPPAAAVKPTPAQIAVGDTIACARMSNETVRCWHGTDAAAPEDKQLRGVKDVVASAGFACALLDDKSVACWGDIGFGAAKSTPKPAGVPGVTKAAHIFAVGGAACAAIEGGALVCWGDIDEHGRITTTGAHRAPTAVAGVDHVVALAARMAAREDGAVVYDKKLLPSLGPQGDAKDVATLDDTSCVLHANGVVSCTPPDPPCAPPPPPPKPARPTKGKKAPPPKAAEPPKPALADIGFGKTSQLAFDLGQLCVLAGGQVACLDPASRCHEHIDHRASPPLDEVDGTCALTSRKRDVVCWPRGGGKAVAIAGVDHVVALAGTTVQACAVDRDHRVSCWKDTGPAAVIPVD